jgi:hypothetical protein
VGFTYDGAGNTKNDGSYTYTWDAESQLASAAGVNYSYDGAGGPHIHILLTVPHICRSQQMWEATPQKNSFVLPRFSESTMPRCPSRCSSRLPSLSPRIAAREEMHRPAHPAAGCAPARSRNFSFAATAFPNPAPASVTPKPRARPLSSSLTPTLPRQC